MREVWKVMTNFSDTEVKTLTGSSPKAWLRGLMHTQLELFNCENIRVYLHSHRARMRPEALSKVLTAFDGIRGNRRFWVLGGNALRRLSRRREATVSKVRPNEH
jgi:hypothetical protein